MTTQLQQHSETLGLEIRPIPGVENYAVSRTGRVFSYNQTDRWGNLLPIREMCLRPAGRTGYLQFRRTLTGRRQSPTSVHVSVARAFHGEKPSPSHQVRHIDGDQLNNHADNLAWGTPAENAADKRRHGTVYYGDDHHSVRLPDRSVAEIRRIYAQGGVTQVELAERFGTSQPRVSNIVRNVIRTQQALETS